MAQRAERPWRDWRKTGDFQKPSSSGHPKHAFGVTEFLEFAEFPDLAGPRTPRTMGRAGSAPENQGSGFEHGGRPVLIPSSGSEFGKQQGGAEAVRRDPKILGPPAGRRGGRRRRIFLAQEFGSLLEAFRRPAEPSVLQPAAQGFPVVRGPWPAAFHSQARAPSGFFRPPIPSSIIVPRLNCASAQPRRADCANNARASTGSGIRPGNVPSRKIVPNRHWASA